MSGHQDGLRRRRCRGTWVRPSMHLGALVLPILVTYAPRGLVGSGEVERGLNPTLLTCGNLGLCVQSFKAGGVGEVFLQRKRPDVNSPGRGK
jgi:hypothetical protein